MSSNDVAYSRRATRAADQLDLPPKQGRCPSRDRSPKGTRCGSDVFYPRLELELGSLHDLGGKPVHEIVVRTILSLKKIIKNITIYYTK